MGVPPMSLWCRNMAETAMLLASFRLRSEIPRPRQIQQLPVDPRRDPSQVTDIPAALDQIPRLGRAQLALFIAVTLQDRRDQPRLHRQPHALDVPTENLRIPL